MERDDDETSQIRTEHQTTLSHTKRNQNFDTQHPQYQPYTNPKHRKRHFAQFAGKASKQKHQHRQISLNRSCVSVRVFSETGPSLKSCNAFRAISDIDELLKEVTI